MNSADNTIHFLLGDQPVSIDFIKQNISPDTTVLNYLRNIAGRKGTKEGCAEGDCGACTVVVAEPDEEGQLHYNSADSCLILLPQLHGKQLITIEDLGTPDNLHQVQQSMVDHHGSQCGFCTPGMVMSLYAMHKSQEIQTRETINDHLSGNLCRCTGYKPILHATVDSLNYANPESLKEREQEIAKILNRILTRKQSINIELNNQIYFLAFQLSDALSFLNDHSNCTILAGGTDVALRINKKHEKIPVILDISGIDEIKQIQLLQNQSLWIGAGVNLETVRQICIDGFPALHSMLSWFGSKQIRNKATLGGNLGSASPIGDTIPVLMAYNAVVVLQNQITTRRVPARGFITGYRKTVLNPGELISAVEIPVPPKQLIVKAYKVSKRKQLDISTVSAAFRLHVDNGTVKEFLAFFGGMAATTNLARNASKFMTEKKWTIENMEQAAELLEIDFKPISDARSEAQTRLNIAKNLFIKFFNETGLAT